MSGKKTILERVSTKPNKDSYCWADGKSLFSMVTLWLIWLARVFSLLQWLKLAFRVVAKKIKTSTTDRQSKRINVPSWFVEVYFLTVLCVEVCLFIFVPGNSMVRICVSAYFVFESFVWILYYTIFRRFFEENYMTQHSLEYFIVFPTVLMSQVIAFSCIFNLKVREVLLGYLCMETSEYVIINVLGFIYQAIVIGMIIASFPEERTKAGLKRIKHVIIGNGSVVKERLLPALDRQNEYIKCIFDIKETKDISEMSKTVCVMENSDEIISEVEKVAQGRSIIWIETPSSDHCIYLKQLIGREELSRSLIVMEKPISCEIDELTEVKEINSDASLRSRIFYLSYYLLEKALPLYFLTTRKEAYRKYLDYSNVELFDNGLGRLKSLNVTIIEGGEQRESVRNDKKIQVYETLIHNVLIASLFAGLPCTWTVQSVQNDTHNDAKNSRMKIKAHSDDTDICLIQEKREGAANNRFALLEYELGTVRMDVDTGVLTISKKGYGVSNISIKKEYMAQKYSIQSDLVIRAFNGDIRCEDCDGLFNQIECLEWLNKVFFSAE